MEFFLEAVLQKSLGIIVLSGFIRLGATTVAEAERALAAHDWAGAAGMAEAICRENGTLNREWGEAMLVWARADIQAKSPEQARMRIGRLLRTAGIDDDLCRRASAVELTLATDAADRLDLAEKFLRRWPAHPDAVPAWLLIVTETEMKRGRPEALAFLKSRPEALRALSEADTPLRDAESRLVRLIKTPPPPAPSPDALAEAEKHFRTGDHRAALREFEAACAPGRPPALRTLAFTRRLECLEEAGRGEEAAAAATTGLSGLATEDFPAPLRITLARIRFENTRDGDVARVEPLLASAFADLPAEAEELESARWLLARVRARRGASREELIATLRDSPTLRECPFPPESPEHPVARLIAAAARPEAWISADLGSPASPPDHPLIRAADGCFAALRFADAAGLYAGFLRRPSLSLSARAYATLQQARSLAFTDRKKDALAVYRRFVTERDLATSPLAPAARLRAGVLCAGALGDIPAALRCYEDLSHDAPRTPEARLAEIYRIAILERRLPAQAVAAKRAFIKARPGDDMVRKYEQSLRAPAKKS